MGSLERRLRALESCQATAERETNLTPAALRRLSDEDLGALEEVLEAGVSAGETDFQNLYAASSERSRRAFDAYVEAVEAVREGQPVPVSESSRGDTLELMRRAWAGDEEAKAEYERRNGYRIWKYRQKEKGRN